MMKKMEEILFAMQDRAYGDFMASLIPNLARERIIGVRTPKLRKLAKEMEDTPEADAFLAVLPHRYYEENNLHAFLVEQKAKSFDTALDMTEAFLPWIDNWATCDSFSPKALCEDLSTLYYRTVQWMESPHVYTVRYGIVTQLKLFLGEAFRPEMLDFIGQLHRDEYYISMAAAWYYSIALIKQPEVTLPVFTERKLDRKLHNRALQKALESRRIDKETKDCLRSLKIK